jgi:EpsI family protein
MATMEQTRRNETGMRWDALAVALGFVVPLVAFHDAAASLLERWLRFDQAYSHGLFVLAVSLFLCFRVLRARRFALRPSAIGLALALAVATGMALADVINIQLLQHLGLVGLWWAGVLAVLGWRAAWHFAIPIGFLFYAIPFWDLLAWPLQRITVAINEFLLGLRGIHFAVEGVYIRLLDIGTFEIASGCSGQRYLVVALTLATLFSSLHFQRLRHWIALHAMAIGLGLLVNWIRVFIIILVGYETRMQSPMIADHEFLGWVLFVFATVPLFYVANRLAGREGDEAAPATDTGARDLVPTPARSAAATALLIAAVAAPALYFARPATGIGSGTAPGLPQAVGPWQRAVSAIGPLWSPTMHGTDHVSQARYEPTGSGADGDGPDAVQGGVWYYASQAQGEELFYYSNRLVDPGNWQVIDRQSFTLPDGGAAELLTLQSRYTDRKVVLAYSYYVGGRWATGAIDSKLALVAAAVRGRRDGALVAAVAQCSGGSSGCEHAEQILTEAFAPQFFDEVAARLERLELALRS